MTKSQTRARRAQARAAVFRTTSALPIAVGAALLAAGPALGDEWVIDWSQNNLAIYEDCVAKTATDPETAYEDGLIFRDAGGGVLARHCIALALLEIGHVEEAAARLEEAAFMPDGGMPKMRAELLAQAGNAWLLAEAPYEAENAFNNAMSIVSGDPDLFIDRARALAMQGRFDAAASDLSVALSLRPLDVEALRLRADALKEAGRYEEALADIDAALAILPNDVPTLVVRGDIREAQRLSGS